MKPNEYTKKYNQDSYFWDLFPIKKATEIYNHYTKNTLTKDDVEISLFHFDILRLIQEYSYPSDEELELRDSDLKKKLNSQIKTINNALKTLNHYTYEEIQTTTTRTQHFVLGKLIRKIFLKINKSLKLSFFKPSITDYDAYSKLDLSFYEEDMGKYIQFDYLLNMTINNLNILKSTLEASKENTELRHGLHQKETRHQELILRLCGLYKQHIKRPPNTNKNSYGWSGDIISFIQDFLPYTYYTKTRTDEAIGKIIGRLKTDPSHAYIWESQKD